MLLMRKASYFSGIRQKCPDSNMLGLVLPFSMWAQHGKGIPLLGS
jgi:hypothetical protein